MRGVSVAVLACCAFGAVSAVSVASSRRMSFVSPQGDQKMILESAERRDLDSSASAYVHYGDGLGESSAQYLSQLHGLPSSAAAPSFSYQVNHDYQPIPLKTFLRGEGSGDSQGFFQHNAKDAAHGYDGYDAFHKGILKKFDNKEDSGFYDKSVGHKKAHTDVGGYHASGNAEAKGEKGKSFGEASSHKKGHKTTGYHNVYHKDEYKKEQVFYDESDHRGYSDNQGKQQDSFELAKGGFEKGSHLDAAHQETEAGRKGFFRKGNSNEESAGHRGASGVDREFSRQSEEGKRGSDDFEKRFGFEEGEH